MRGKRKGVGFPVGEFLGRMGFSSPHFLFAGPIGPMTKVPETESQLGPSSRPWGAGLDLELPPVRHSAAFSRTDLHECETGSFAMELTRLAGFFRWFLVAVWLVPAALLWRPGLPWLLMAPLLWSWFLFSSVELPFAARGTSSSVPLRWGERSPGKGGPCRGSWRPTC